MEAQENQNSALWFVDSHINKRENKLAFVEIDGKERGLTYGKLASQSNLMIDLYQRHNINQESRAVMLALDTIDFPIIFWGSIKAGVIPVPLNTLLSQDLYLYMLNDSRAKSIFISSELLPMINDILKDLDYLEVIFVIGKYDIEIKSSKIKAYSLDDELLKSTPKPCVYASNDDIAFWLYSSGSTGRPKGIQHIHSNLKAIADNYGKHILQIKEEDVVYSIAKMFFGYGLGNSIVFPMSVGATTHIYSQRPTPQSTLDCIEKVQPSIFYAVPTLYAALLAYMKNQCPKGTKNLRLCISAGEALPQHLGELWKEIVNVDILDGVGSTEMFHIFLSNSSSSFVYGASGKAVTGYELKLVDENSKEVAIGEIGELLVKGDSSADKYWNQREKSKATFEGFWTRTGDKYTKNKNGFYTYCGRTDDMFKVSGIWVSPFEIEQALINHDDVLESAVVAKKDNDGLLKPKAFIVLKENVKTKGLKEILKELVKNKIGKWKYPRLIEFVDELPKTSTGKIQRFKLRELSK